MDLGALEIQIFISLVVVLGAAFVALICDYLKGHNEQLRERYIELRVRSEEQEKLGVFNPSLWLSHLQMGREAAGAGPVAPVQPPFSSAAPEAALAAVEDRAKNLEEQIASVSRSMADAEAAPSSSEGYNKQRSIFSSRRGEKAPRPTEDRGNPAGSPSSPLRENVPASSSSMKLDEEIQRVARLDRTVPHAPPIVVMKTLPDIRVPSLKLEDEIERVAAFTPKPSEEHSLLEDVIAASSAKLPTPRAGMIQLPVAPEPVALLEAPAALAPLPDSPAADVADTLEPHEMLSAVNETSPEPFDTFVLEEPSEVLPETFETTLEPELELEPEQDNTAEEEVVLFSEVVEEGAAPSDLLLPAGMQDKSTYLRLLDMPGRMSGIAIVIAINDFPRLVASQTAEQHTILMNAVDGFMQSMVRDGDFGVQVENDQWIFVYRFDEYGLAQRRVSNLSEKLWDFQLRHLGFSNLSFEWAAVNVEHEKLSDAVSAAYDRMEASKESSRRKSDRKSRLVVNG